MYFPAIVKNCKEFDYITKKGTNATGYSVTVQLDNYETYALFANQPFTEGEPCVMTITPGNWSKPYINLEKVPKSA